LKDCNDERNDGSKPSSSQEENADVMLLKDGFLLKIIETNDKNSGKISSCWLGEK
jgi:hypothetical protein